MILACGITLDLCSVSIAFCLCSSLVRLQSGEWSGVAVR